MNRMSLARRDGDVKVTANMTALSAATRDDALRQMAETPLDVLVIGGGITGAGIALDAAARGYRVGLVERGDFAGGTSSRSTKLVHGGIRYLPQLDLPLVREALIERGRLLRNAPHLVQPLSFVLPLYASSRHPVGLPIAPPWGIGLGMILNIGLGVYDALAGRENVGAHRRITRGEVLARAQCLVPDGLKTGFIYYDAQTDDSRLTLAVLRTAAAQGALLANYAEVTGFLHEGGRVVGGSVRDCLTDTRYELHARHVINATGVWAEQIERLAGDSPMLRIAPSKGTHLVFSREAFDLGDEAIVLPETEDGRIIFIVPWLSRALVGTTDDPAARIETPVATEDEISYLLGHVNRYVRRRVSRDDVIATFAGYRPLIELQRGRTPSRLSRTHAIVEGEDRLLTISGGKLTTYRRMAEDALDRIDRREGRSPSHPTQVLHLAGASGLAETREALETRGAALEIGEDTIKHLRRAYGSDALALLDLVEADPTLAQRLAPDLPNIAAEVVWACQAELALTVEDVLARRTHLAIEDRSRGVDSAEVVATLMARELGWPAAERQRQIEGYRRFAREQAGLRAEMPGADETQQRQQPLAPRA